MRKAGEVKRESTGKRKEGNRSWNIISKTVQWPSVTLRKIIPKVRKFFNHPN